MFKHIFETVGKEISGENAKNLATEVTRFHRIQVSPHFREAAEWCQNQLKEYGLHCEIHQFRADGKIMYWTSLLPKEWKIESATLEIDGKIWADFRDKKVSLIQRSHPIDAEAELVHVETDDEEAFRTVKGKIVHSPLPLESIKDFALHYGALGIITSGIREITMRTRIDVPDAVHYFSFWGEKGSGFVLSPRQGEKLKKLIKEKEKKEESAIARMVIKSELYPGFMEVVDAFIPGKTDEEVLIVAHLCHPQPSANDNASGDGALMEVARTLQKLIKDTKLE
jgi:aminopeptidase YwaD